MKSIKSIFPQERPRERCLTHGPSCLSLRECLALILGSGPKDVGCLGLSSLIISRAAGGDNAYENDIDRAFFIGMETSGLAQLSDIPGLGSAGRTKVLAALEIGRRYAMFREQVQKKPQPNSQLRKALHNQALDQVPGSFRTSAQEWLGFVCVYNAEKLGAFNLVERGARTHINVDPMELFARVLALRPYGFYLFHNHPSGELRASADDISLTRRTSEVAKMLGVRLLGHGIVTSEDAHWIVFN